ncbi:MAG: type II secretion system F family protein [Anaerolineaceae bacterium]|jgi:tight adherence protein B
MDPTTVLWIGGAIILILIAIGLIITFRSQRSAEEERIDQYVDFEDLKPEKKSDRSSPVSDWLTKEVEKSSYGDRIARDLAQADLKLKPGEYVVLMVVLAVLGVILLYAISGKSIVFGLAGGVLGAMLPKIYVSAQQRKRLIKFNEQLSDMLNLMVNGIRAGYSTLQALEAVSRELPPPICDEFHRVVQEVQLGLPMESALDNLLRRIPSDDLDLVITAMNVQREVGGNLAEILDTISHTIRERVKLKGEIRVLTTQQSYTGKLLAILPVGLFVILYFINRSYIGILFDKEANAGFPCGYFALGLAGFLIVIGYLVMKKVAQIEV